MVRPARSRSDLRRSCQFVTLQRATCIARRELRLLNNVWRCEHHLAHELRQRLTAHGLDGKACLGSVFLECPVLESCHKRLAKPGKPLGGNAGRSEKWAAQHER